MAAISVSGSAIVCSREIGRIASRRLTVAAPAGRPRLRPTEIEQSILRAYPSYEVLDLREPQQADRPDLAVLENRKEHIARLFDPYTGEDLGDRSAILFAAVFRAGGEQRDGVDPNLSGPVDCRSGNGIQGLALQAADGYTDHAPPRGNVTKVPAVLVKHLNTDGR